MTSLHLQELQDKVLELEQRFAENEKLLIATDSQNQILVKEVSGLKKMLETKEVKINLLASAKAKLKEDQRRMELKLTESQHHVDRLEQGQQDPKNEMERLKKELEEERMRKNKEKSALENDIKQLQRKVEYILALLGVGEGTLYQHRTGLRQCIG